MSIFIELGTNLHILTRSSIHVNHVTKSKMDWDFNGANTRQLTHGLHTYPAKMIPQVAAQVLQEFCAQAELVFDPYCGSGTTLVEANLRNINAIGVDLNPLARLITSVKTTPIEIQSLELHLRDFYEYLFQFRYNVSSRDSVVAPSFPRIDFWFSRSVKQHLAVIKEYVDRIENQPIKAFFNVAFSQTIRDCSWTRNNEFKLYKMSADKVKTFSPDVFATFEKQLAKNRNGLVDYMEQKANDSESQILSFNSVQSIPKRVIKRNSVDIVLTSPPYGDSSTTVAYGQFSALANQWLGLMENGRQLDKSLMGGISVKRGKTFQSEALNSNLSAVAAIDNKRAYEVISFYSDYEKSIRNVAETIKPGGFSCYVVSNRMVRGTRLLTDQITRDFFENNGFDHISTFRRIISSKRMPRQNSSTGKKGQTTELMNEESIVIMQKRKAT
jgi:site-specific DNA-methyltransferase (cytosine-N4-specific)